MDEYLKLLQDEAIAKNALERWAEQGLDTAPIVKQLEELNKRKAWFENNSESTQGDEKEKE